MALKSTDTIDVRQAESGGKVIQVTVAEVNELISSEEDARITTLEEQVGDYDPETTTSTITDDLEQLQTDVQAEDTGLLDRTTVLEAASQTAKSGKPVTPVAASAVLTAADALSDGNTATVNDRTYTFKTALTTDPATVPGEILIGANKEASMTNLKKAINGEATEGTNYSTGTLKPAGVAATVDGAAVTCTATVAGVLGNAYPKAAVGANLDWDGTGAFFTLGVDGTAGAAGALRFDADGLYVSTDVSTTAVSNWQDLLWS